jgi:hypothetical protein
MGVQARTQHHDIRQDGFGARRIEHDPEAGRVEVLDLSPSLASAAAEQAIRARAARFAADSHASMLAPVIRVRRAGVSLSVTTAAPEGVTLADFLSALEFGTITLPAEALLTLTGDVICAVAAMHDLTGAPVHGSLCPEHVLLRRDGGVLLTGALFGDALQLLQLNREQLWRTFGVALPPSASLPRFDQRSDVTELGALVLAILLSRPLASSEYPRGIDDLVNAATATGPHASALRNWLRHALLLHSKSVFASAADAARGFDEIVGRAQSRQLGAHALYAAIRDV